MMADDNRPAEYNWTMAPRVCVQMGEPIENYNATFGTRSKSPRVVKFIVLLKSRQRYSMRYEAGLVCRAANNYCEITLIFPTELIKTDIFS